MIEVHLEGDRHGDAYAGQNITKGKWVQIRAAQTDVWGTFRVMELPLAAPLSPANMNTWPCDALVYDNDIEDTTGLGTEANPAPADPTGQYNYRFDSNIILSGQRMVYFEEGEYITDQFDGTEITAATLASSLLYVNSTVGATQGQLQTTVNGVAVAMLIRFIVGGTNYTGLLPAPPNQIHFRMY